MRILLVTTWFPSSGHPAVGSFVARDVAALATVHEVRVVHLVAPHLAGDGPEVGVERLDFPGLEPVEVLVHRVVTDLRRPDHLARAARVVAKRLAGADVLHTAAFSTLLPLVGCRVTVPWVHTEHWSGLSDTASQSAGLRVAVPLLRRLLCRPDVVTAVSRYALAPVLAERAGKGAGESRVVPCLVQPVVPVPVRRADDGTLRLVAVGGLVPGKNPVLAVETLAELRARGVDASLTWVGGGPLASRVRAEAARLGVESSLRLTQAVNAAGVAEELAAADLFLLPTRRETFCVAAAEAIASGRPVVIGSAGGHTEFLDPAVCELVDLDDGPAISPASLAVRLADAVQRLAERTRELSAQDVAATIGDRFDAAHVREGYESAYSAAGAGEIAMMRPRPDPVVDVVIAVHTTDRPIARAVTSVLANRGPVRVTVVCHHVEVAEIARLLGDVPERARAVGHEVRLVRLVDGLASPAGPFNAGLELAGAPFVSIMGSDDRLAPGAIDSWLALERTTGADVVLPRLQLARPHPGLGGVDGLLDDGTGLGLDGALDDGLGGRVVPTPPARPGRTKALDPVRDRLSYRSAPLGLLRRETIERLGLRMAQGLGVGEDVAFSTRLWFEAAGVAFDRRGPAYLVGTDAGNRVTSETRPLAIELTFLHDVLDAEWFSALDVRARRAFAAKAARIHVFGAVHNRPDPAAWTLAERLALRAAAEQLAHAAPGYERVLSIADRDLLDAVLDARTGGVADGARLLRLSVRRRRHGRPATLFPRDLRCLAAREAPLRLMAASVLVGR